MSVTVGDCAVKIVGTPCRVRGSDQIADDPRVCAAPEVRPDAGGCRAGWDAGRAANGGEVSDVEPAGDDLRGGAAAAPRSSDVELPRGGAAGGGAAAAPRSNDVEPPRDCSTLDDAGPRSSGALGPSRSNDVEPDDLGAGPPDTGGDGCPPGAGPDRSSEVLAPDGRCGADGCGAGRPAGVGPDRSNDVFDAPVVARAAGADRCAAGSTDDGLPGVSDRSGAPGRGAGLDRPSPEDRAG